MNDNHSPGELTLWAGADHVVLDEVQKAPESPEGLLGRCGARGAFGGVL